MGQSRTVGDLTCVVAGPTREIDVPRMVAVLFFVAAMLGFSVPSANAAPDSQLEPTLAALWAKVFDTPPDQNPVVGGNGSPCWNLGGTVAPLGAGGVASCTVKPGTKIFVATFTSECSTYPGDTCSGPGVNDETLRSDARSSDLVQAGGAAPTLKLDGNNVALADLTTIVHAHALPGGNVFGLPAGTTGRYAAHGWVALLHPLTPGTHTVGVTSVNPKLSYTTKIIVQPGNRGV